MYYVVLAIYIVVCFVLMLVILLQQGKGGDISAAFGGGGGSQTAFGARSGATVLTRATTILAILFVVGALALGIMRQGGGGSVVGSTPAPASVPTQANPAPLTPPTQ